MCATLARGEPSGFISSSSSFTQSVADGRVFHTEKTQQKKQQQQQKKQQTIDPWKLKQFYKNLHKNLFREPSTQSGISLARTKQMNILQLVSYLAMLVHFEVTATHSMCWLHRKCLIL